MYLKIIYKDKNTFFCNANSNDDVHAAMPMPRFANDPYKNTYWWLLPDNGTKIYTTNSAIAWRGKRKGESSKSGNICVN